MCGKNLGDKLRSVFLVAKIGVFCRSSKTWVLEKSKLMEQTKHIATVKRKFLFISILCVFFAQSMQENYVNKVKEV